MSRLSLSLLLIVAITGYSSTSDPAVASPQFDDASEASPRDIDAALALAETGKVHEAVNKLKALSLHVVHLQNTAEFHGLARIAKAERSCMHLAATTADDGGWIALAGYSYTLAVGCYLRMMKAWRTSLTGARPAMDYADFDDMVGDLIDATADRLPRPPDSIAAKIEYDQHHFPLEVTASVALKILAQVATKSGARARFKATFDRELTRARTAAVGQADVLAVLDGLDASLRNAI